MKNRINTIVNLFLLGVLGASSIWEQNNSLLLTFKIIALTILSLTLGWKVLTAPSAQKKSPSTRIQTPSNDHNNTDSRP